MKYSNIEEMKRIALELFLNGKNYTEIANSLGCSRNYISHLINNEDEVIKRKYTKVFKVYKNPNGTKKHLTIGIELLSLIGVSRNKDENDYVKIIFDEKNKNLILKKYEI